jgi:exonuclease VII large subunit
MDNYHKKYYADNKEDWFKKVKCDICKGSYTRASKSTHIKTKKHITCLEYINKENNLINIEKKLNNIEDNHLTNTEQRFDNIEKKLNNIEDNHLTTTEQRFDNIEKKLNNIEDIEKKLNNIEDNDLIDIKQRLSNLEKNQSILSIQQQLNNIEKILKK